MKTLTNRTEIATTINFNKMPVVRIDLAKKDDYGVYGTKVRIHNGSFKDGNPYYINARLRTYDDMNGLHFAQYGDCLKAELNYYDMEEMLEFANAPIIEKDQDICVVFVDSELEMALYPKVLRTGKEINAFCQTPLTIEEC